MMTINTGMVRWREELVWVSGGIPLWSEYDGQVLFPLPWGFDGQQALFPKLATLPEAALSFQPAHCSQDTTS